VATTASSPRRRIGPVQQGLLVVYLVGTASEACWGDPAVAGGLAARQHPRPRPAPGLLNVLPAIGPGTIIRLDDAQHYLRPNDERLGEHVATGVLGQFRDPAREPLLVLATIWPKEYGLLTEAPTTATHVKRLLAAPTFVVPDHVRSQSRRRPALARHRAVPTDGESAEHHPP
jgi:hypothetical protein